MSVQNVGLTPGGPVEFCAFTDDVICRSHDANRTQRIFRMSEGDCVGVTHVLFSLCMGEVRVQCFGIRISVPSISHDVPLALACAMDRLLDRFHPIFFAGVALPTCPWRHIRWHRLCMRCGIPLHGGRHFLEHCQTGGCAVLVSAAGRPDPNAGSSWQEVEARIRG